VKCNYTQSEPPRQMGVGAQLRAQPHYPREGAALPIVQEAAWLHDWSGGCAEEKMSFPPPSFEPFQPVTSRYSGPRVYCGVVGRHYFVPISPFS
jgi:hypothetical protein